MRGEEIAVLDGLGDIPSSYNRGPVIDASAGANYSGGSSWPGDLPLTPSNAGLAAHDDLINGYYNRGAVIDASAGANYSGGSSWPGDLPLTPSNAGLAGLAAAANMAAENGSLMPISTLMFQQIMNMLGAGVRADGVWGPSSAAGLLRLDDSPETLKKALAEIKPVAGGKILIMPIQYIQNLVRAITRRMAAAAAGAMSGLGDTMRLKNGYYNRGAVIDASAGGNYSGGSSWPGDLPLTPSNAGLADTYDGGRLEDIDRNYGSCMEATPFSRSSGIPNYYNQGQVIDASAGANYSGGSSWPGDLPLTPSNAGLAELSLAEPVDQVSDNAFRTRLMSSQMPAFKRMLGNGRLTQVKRDGMRARKNGNFPLANAKGLVLKRMRALRRKLMGLGMSPAAITAAMNNEYAPTTMVATRVA